MESHDLTERPEITNRDALDRRALERKLQEADVARPGTFRYSDAKLGGEVRTSVVREGGRYDVAQAEVFRRNDTPRVVGRAPYTIADGEAKLRSTEVKAANYGVETALLNEVSERARAQGVDRLRIWVPDDDPSQAYRWQNHGFHPGERDPGAAGVSWERPLSAA
jgi:GNAT superfamily N-acetyltransferase